MDPDEPLFIAIGKIAVALKEYRETVISYNKVCVEEIIEEEQRMFDRDAKAQVGINDGRWALDRRLDRIWRISLGMSGPVSTTIQEPRDFLTMIDFLPDGIEPPTSPETRECGFRDLQDKVKEAAKSGWSDRLELPTQILALMTLTNGVYGPGLRPHRLAGEALEVFIDILFTSLVDFPISLDEVVKAVWLGPDSMSNEKYDIVAGFECGSCQFAACSVLYCRKLGVNEEGNEPWGWRIAVWEHYDFQVSFFDDVPSFLKWHSEWGRKRPGQRD